MARRVAAIPFAGRVRQAELVHRDDVEHHLLVTLHQQIDTLATGLATVQQQLAALDQARLRSDATARQAVDAARDAEHTAADVASDVAHLAVRAADLDPPEPVADGPLVTVVLPTWQRAAILGDAIRSVCAQTHRRWVLLVVDDGSDDGTDAVVKPLLADDRIHYHRVRHGGVSAARNHALDLARGEIVAYLDSDNTWHPTHLARLVQALTTTDAQWGFSGQVLFDGRTGRARLRKDLRAVDTLVDGNYVDLNAVAHRRSVIARTGTFDPDLTRLTDWDFVLRLAQIGPPARTGAATSLYREDVDGRISDHEPLHHQHHRVRARHRGLPAAGLRILFAEWHYLQLTETYVAALTQAFVALGADVSVWADAEPSVPTPAPLVVHRGALEDAIAEVRPDLVVTNWLNKGIEFRPTTLAAGLPHVVRSHGFDHDPALTHHLLADRGVLVHTFPHLIEPELAGHPRLVAEYTAFDDARYAPATDKDRRMVMRTSAGLFTKDLETFMVAATLCPDHHFLLVIGHSLLVEERTEALVERARELGSPCEIRLDLLHDEMAELIGRAGIYLHTHGTDHVLGMPISIAESMATGGYVLARDLPGMADYVGAAGVLYDGATVEERAAAAAALVRATTAWSDDQWGQVRERSIDQAFRRHAGRDVAERMLRTWQTTFPQLRR